jgi:hypothetical protein
MRTKLWSGAAIACAALVAACASSAPTASTGGGNGALGNPDSLAYLLLPGGPAQPAGVVLTWAPASDPNVAAYVIYGRAASTSTWSALAITGGLSFFDNQTGFAQYYVASEDGSGNVSTGTPAITVNYNPTIGAPDSLTGAAFDGAVALHWGAGQRHADSTIFSNYRVYSELAQVTGATTTCPATSSSFGLEGTTVSEDFVVTGLTNGTPWCYGARGRSRLGKRPEPASWGRDPTQSGGLQSRGSTGGDQVAQARTRRCVGGIRAVRRRVPVLRTPGAPGRTSVKRALESLSLAVELFAPHIVLDSQSLTIEDVVQWRRHVGLAAARSNGETRAIVGRSSPEVTWSAASTGFNTLQVAIPPDGLLAPVNLVRPVGVGPRHRPRSPRHDGPPRRMSWPKASDAGRSHLLGHAECDSVQSYPARAASGPAGTSRRWRTLPGRSSARGRSSATVGLHRRW